MLALIPVLVWICCQSQAMNMLALGETSARQLGLPLWFWRNLLVVATGWMVGVSVALAGAIGFIGLVIPHILRLCGLNGPSRAVTCLCAGGGHCATAGRCGRSPGAGLRRIANWRGHRDARRTGFYLAVTQSRTLGTTRQSMIRSWYLNHSRSWRGYARLDSEHGSDND
ncbi:vitamin B12 ABC transporter permease [Citrobacter amalonaticus]|nr:vitamin B12 ABC transporter permease [Citrobacter amalonaticus]